jgi:hypothetical protein
MRAALAVAMFSVSVMAGCGSVQGPTANVGDPAFASISAAPAGRIHVNFAGTLTGSLDEPVKCEAGAQNLPGGKWSGPFITFDIQNPHLTYKNVPVIELQFTAQMPPVGTGQSANVGVGITYSSTQTDSYDDPSASTSAQPLPAPTTPHQYPGKFTSNMFTYPDTNQSGIITPYPPSLQATGAFNCS